MQAVAFALLEIFKKMPTERLGVRSTIYHKLYTVTRKKIIPKCLKIAGTNRDISNAGFNDPMPFANTKKAGQVNLTCPSRFPTSTQWYAVPPEGFQT